MYILRVKSHFDAAHYLPWHDGKCKNLHGHRWEVEVVITAQLLNENGVVIDFGDIKALLPDHANLNEWLDNPTAENIADGLYKAVESLLEKENTSYQSLSVQVWENPNCSIEKHGMKKLRWQ